MVSVKWLLLRKGDLDRVHSTIVFVFGTITVILSLKTYQPIYKIFRRTATLVLLIPRPFMHQRVFYHNEIYLSRLSAQINLNYVHFLLANEYSNAKDQNTKSWESCANHSVDVDLFVIHSPNSFVHHRGVALLFNDVLVVIHSL